MEEGLEAMHMWTNAIIFVIAMTLLMLLLCRSDKGYKHILNNREGDAVVYSEEES